MSEQKPDTDEQRTEVALEVLADLSERATGDGRLRDAIAVVRDALWSDLDDDPVYPRTTPDGCGTCEWEGYPADGCPHSTTPEKRADR